MKTNLWLLALCLAIFHANLATAQLAFGPPVYPPDIQNIDKIAVGDFDGNGQKDIAFNTELDGAVYIHYNQGANVFSLTKVDGIALANPGHTNYMEAGDLNEDGKADLVIIDLHFLPTPRIAILTSTGPSFTIVYKPLPATSSSFNLKVIDFNKDGHKDIICANQEEQFIVHYGNGQGQFTESVQKLAIGQKFVIADFNNDSKLDVAFAGPQNVTVCLQTATDVYTKVSKAFAFIVLAMASGDFSGDGVPDLMLSVFENGNSRLEYWVSDGAGGFAAPQVITTRLAPRTNLEAIDYDTDGRVDIIIGAWAQADALIVLRNVTTGFFDASPTSLMSNTIVDLEIADLDGNGTPEVIDACTKSINIQQRISGVYSLSKRLVLGVSTFSGCVADLNKDQIPDIVSASTNGAVAISYGKGGLQFEKPIFFDVGLQVTNVNAADFNGDGFDDLLYGATHPASPPYTPYLRLSNGPSTFDAQVPVPDATAFAILVADFNSDSKPDFASPSGVYVGNGNGTFTKKNTFTMNFPWSLNAGHFDNDSDIDIVATENGVTSIFLNDGTGVFGAPITVPTSLTAIDARTVNYNNDGLDDLLMRLSTENFRLLIMINQGNNTFTETVINIPDNTAIINDIIGGDLDNNGSLELIAGISAPLPGNQAILGVGILKQTTPGTFAFASRIDNNPFKNSQGIPNQFVLSDLDGDTHKEIVAFRANGVALSVVPNATVIEPTMQATLLTPENLTATSVTLKVSKGNGKGRLITIRESAKALTAPTDGIFYAVNTVFGTAAKMGDDNFVVMRGNAESVSVTALKAETPYAIAAFEFNGSDDIGLINYLTSSPATIQLTTKKTQTITFAAPADKVIGDAASTLTATSTSGLTVAFSALTTNITVTGNSLGVVSTGKARVKATQTGDNVHEPAPPVEVTFCVNPTKPTITIETISAGKFRLSSSSNENNQWFRNSESIPNATSKTYEPTLDGVYTVRVTENECNNVSEGTTHLIVGLKEEQPIISVYPIPSDGHFMIMNVPYHSEFKVIDTSSQTISAGWLNIGDNELVLSPAPGMYFLRVANGGAHKLVVK